jgi:glycosyltransferase involved in cell wall biosynthesis
VGESARHIEPGANIDRIGWVRQTHEEYRDAAVVVLPVRMASGFHRRLVEAISWGKAVVATPEGAAGLAAEHADALLVAETPEDFAAAAARVLTSDVLRRRLEVRSLEVAREAFVAGDALRPLVEWLGLRQARALAPRVESFPVEEPALV